jgi:hypothetical protein
MSDEAIGRAVRVTLAREGELVGVTVTPDELPG